MSTAVIEEAKSNMIILFVDDQAVLINSRHSMYKRLILLDGFVFSKSQMTHALQHYSSIRDEAIERLCHQGFFLRKKVFAKKTFNDNVEYLEGYIKVVPPGNDVGSDIEEMIQFATMLSQYDISIEEYIQSFFGKNRSIHNSDGRFTKHQLTRSDIKLKSFLFSTNFVEFITKNEFYSQRFTISDDATCIIDPSVIPTMSNTRMFTFFH